MLVGLIVAGCSWFWMQKRLAQEYRTADVPVAARDIAARQVVGPEDVAVETLPQARVDLHAVRNPGEIVGKAALQPIPAGAQIRAEWLIDPRLLLGPGERAVAVPVSDQSQIVGNTLSPGDLVDVYFVGDANVPGQLLVQEARILEMRTREGQPLQVPGKVSVLQIGVQQLAPGQGQPGIVVLAVPSGLVPGLARAVAGGKVVLAKIDRQAASHGPAGVPSLAAPVPAVSEGGLQGGGGATPEQPPAPPQEQPGGSAQ
jgi:Flp pilus assembly protein CpaB